MNDSVAGPTRSPWPLPAVEGTGSPANSTELTGGTATDGGTRHVAVAHARDTKRP